MPGERALQYHDATKHHFSRFARSLGYLDWATQPDPFRRYAGSPLTVLPRGAPSAGVPYGALFDGSAPPQGVSGETIGEFLRCSMGLSAWKQYGASRWALRVNPSSGNLHPTETYIVWRGCVSHYAVREHGIEERCRVSGGQGEGSATGQIGEDDAFLVGLTSIHWREAWKYGERAFRYCQHDAGHAIAALRVAAALLGWRMALLPRWSHAQIASLLGVDRDADFTGAEREEPECLAVVSPGDLSAWLDQEPAPIVAAAAEGAWSGQANRLSTDHVDWPIVDEIAAATRYPGPLDGARASHPGTWHPRTSHPSTSHPSTPHPPSHPRTPAPSDAPSHPPHPRTLAPPLRESARSVVLRRRSALAFDGRGVLRRETFVGMLERLRPPAAPWDAIAWPPEVHLAIFVHRVQDVAPGLYAFLRDPAVLAEWRGAMRQEFLWEPAGDGLSLLVPIDCRGIGTRLACDQDIAGDGFFSLAMLARTQAVEDGDWVYRRLFWECGMIGQVLYLEAEAAGARATGIGCFYDDPVHETLGLTGHAWQSLYHFSMGLPVEDARLTTESGYPWE